MVFYNRLLLKIEYRSTGKCTTARTLPKKYRSIPVYRYFLHTPMSLLKVNIELLATSRQGCDMTVKIIDGNIKPK